VRNIKNNELEYRYKVVFKALELACKVIESANIEISNSTDFDMINHKIHGTLVGFFLSEATIKQLFYKRIIKYSY
jgi:hypothetical protein